MAVYYALGDELLDQKTAQKKHDEKIVRAAAEIGKGKKPISVLKGGPAITLREFEAVIRTLEAHGTPAAKPPKSIPFTAIDIGKPLTIEIREAYVGTLPSGGWFNIDGKSAVIVTSAVKNRAAFNAAPRAINLVKEHAAAREHLEPTAIAASTPLVYHSPALTDSNLLMTIEMALDDFDGAALKKLATIAQGASTIPAFAPAAGYLLVGSQVLSVAEKLLSQFFDRGPVFTVNEEINFTLAGATKDSPGFAVLTEGDASLGNGEYRIVDGRVVDDKNKPYSGDTPYVLISIDGAEQDEAYKDFTPTVASAAVLERFFAISATGSGATDVIMDALKLYNDMKFRKRAEALKDRLAKMPAGDPDRADVMEELKANLANILTDELKLEPPSS